MDQVFTLLHKSKGLPLEKKTLANVVGGISFPGVILAALYPYRDFEEVRSEMDLIRESRDRR